MTTKKVKIDKENQIPVQIILKAVIARPDTENRTNKVLPVIKISIQFPNERIKGRLILLPKPDQPYKTLDDAVKEGDRIKQKLLENRLAQIISKEEEEEDTNLEK